MFDTEYYTSGIIREIEDQKWNVPGNVDYQPEEPIDVVLRSDEDSRKRGYWLVRDIDGNLALVSTNEGADHLELSYDEDGTPVITFSEQTTEFYYDGIESIRIKRYS